MCGKNVVAMKPEPFVVYYLFDRWSRCGLEEQSARRGERRVVTAVVRLQKITDGLDAGSTSYLQTTSTGVDALIPAFARHTTAAASGVLLAREERNSNAGNTGSTDTPPGKLAASFQKK